MPRLLARPTLLALALGLASIIPVGVALIDTVAIPTGIVPAGSDHLAVAPLAWWLHAATGAAFGILGPVQLVGALRRRYGRAHRWAGRAFVLAGLVIGLSGHVLLWRTDGPGGAIIDTARGVFGTALIAALLLGILSARRRDRTRHCAWMIRAYALGMGTSAVLVVFPPLYPILGGLPAGPGFDLVHVLAWVATLALAEAIIRHNQTGAPP
jgi:hypothetical protein